jgi:septum formation protein
MGVRHPRLGAVLALGGGLGLEEAVERPRRGVRPILLASTSPQRRAILEQLGISFDVVAPAYEENDPPGLSPVEAVRAHAVGKARSVAHLASGRPVVGVDTEVVIDGQVLGKPGSMTEAAVMIRRLGGRAHDVVSGICLIGDGLEETAHDVTRVLFRELAAREVDAYVATGEWEGRAGAYAIQGRGAALVERIEGDYLNVVGLPAAMLIQVLKRRFPGVFGNG